MTYKRTALSAIGSREFYALFAFWPKSDVAEIEQAVRSGEIIYDSTLDIWAENREGSVIGISVETSAEESINTIAEHSEARLEAVDFAIARLTRGASL